MKNSGSTISLGRKIINSEVSQVATIEIGNIHSTLVDASINGIRAINDALAVHTPGASFSSSYRRGNWDGMTRFFKLETKKFPTGLLTEAVIALRKAGETVELKDLRDKIGYTLPEEIQLLHDELGSITLRDYQYESVAKGLESSRGIINVATNGGKTEIACGIIQCILPHLKNGQKIAFFTHSKEIFSQSHKRLEERLNIKVGRIGEGKWEDEHQVLIVMIPTIARYMVASRKAPSNQDATKFKDKLKKTKVLLKSIVGFIGDEAHHSSSDTWYQLFMKLESAYYRFGLTGTVDEADDKAIGLKRLHGCTGKIVTKISNKFLIDNGYSAKPTIYMIRYDADTVAGTDYPDSRKEGIIYCEERNDVFTDLVQEELESGNTCLIIVNETEHGEEVMRYLEDKKVPAKISHGDKSDKYRKGIQEELRSGELKVLVVTTIFDEGVDISGINCIFLMAGGKSMRMLLQRIGRGLRKKADGSGVKVYDGLDYHNEYLVDHTLDRYNTYTAEEFEVIKLDRRA